MGSPPRTPTADASSPSPSHSVPDVAVKATPPRSSRRVWVMEWYSIRRHGSDLLVQLDGLPAMAQAVLSNNLAVQLEATTQSRKLLSIVVPIFVKLLNSHS